MISRRQGGGPIHASTPRWENISVALLALVLLLLAARHLLTPYSYWGDEMYSVVESLSPPWEFWKNWILWDVHPPLYQVLLKGWMGLFGTGEVATRLLSFLFVALALGFMAWFTTGRPFLFRLVAVGFLGSSPAFAYYGQETRSYGMALALSTLVTLLAMDLRAKRGEAPLKERWLFAISALLLSLTHYFGLVWVGLLAAMQILAPTTPSERRQGLLLLPWLMIWPLIHLVFGELVSKTGGSFWIELPVPGLSSLNRALTGLLPGLEVSRQPKLLVRWVLVVAALLVLSWPLSTWARSLRSGPAFNRLAVRQSTELGVLIVIFIALVAMVDLQTPISTARNFIVLLPALALLLAGWSEALATRLGAARRGFLVALLTLVLLLQLNSAADFVAKKAYPPSNWKQLGSALNQSGICRDGCLSDIANTYFDYYFTGLLPIPKSGAGIGERPLVLRDPLKPPLKSLAADHLCLQARQSAGSPVVLLPPRRFDEAASAAAGLTPCQPNRANLDPEGV